MKVAVLGAAGGMGSFFVRYFLARGDEVTGSDVREAKGGAGFTFFKTNGEAVRGCDVTIVATPMDRAVEVAAEVSKSLKKGSVLVDVSSVKGGSISRLRRLVGRDARLLSIHPLFGPALESTEGMKIAVVTGKRGGEAGLARELFPEARIVLMTAEEHDRAMAVVLSLTHMLNLVYAKTVLGFMTPEEFMKVSTPNSSMQLTLAEAVLAQDPRLSYLIQTGDAHTGRVARRAARELRRAMDMVERGDWRAFEAYFEALARAYRPDRRSSAAIREVYSAAEKAA